MNLIKHLFVTLAAGVTAIFIAKKKGWLGSEAKGVESSTIKWWNDFEVGAAESLAIKILGAKRYTRAMTDPVIIRTKHAYVDAPDGTEKSTARKAYLDVLNDLVRAYIEPTYVRRFGNPEEILFSERKSRTTATIVNIFIVIALVGLFAAAAATLY